MDSPHGQGSSQENIVQVTPSVSSSNLQSSSVPPSSHATPQRGEQTHSLHSIAAAPIPELVRLFHQLTRSVTEEEKNLPAAGNSDGEAERQALRAKLDNQKQLMRHIRDTISARTGGTRLAWFLLVVGIL
jgi:hypothetical protein